MSARRLADRVVDWTLGHLRQLRTITRKRATERELDEELAYHIELETRKNLAAGMSPAEARRAALVEFGGRTGRRPLMSRSGSRWWRS